MVTKLLYSITKYQNTKYQNSVNWVQTKKEVISDLKRENQLLTSNGSLCREICKPVLKLDFTAHGTIEPLSEFEPCGLKPL
jgi:hypothetical protein